MAACGRYCAPCAPSVPCDPAARLLPVLRLTMWAKSAIESRLDVVAIQSNCPNGHGVRCWIELGLQLAQVGVGEQELPWTPKCLTCMWVSESS